MVCSVNQYFTELNILKRFKNVDGTDAFDTLYIGCEKFPQHDIFSVSTRGVI